MLRGITRYEYGRKFGCVTGDGDWGRSIAGAQIEGFQSFKDGGRSMMFEWAESSRMILLQNEGRISGGSGVANAAGWIE